MKPILTVLVALFALVSGAAAMAQAPPPNQMPPDVVPRVKSALNQIRNTPQFEGFALNQIRLEVKSRAGNNQLERKMKLIHKQMDAAIALTPTQYDQQRDHIALTIAHIMCGDFRDVRPGR